MRQFLSIGLLCCASVLCGQQGRFYTKAEVLARAYPDADRAFEWRRSLSDGEKLRLERQLRRKIVEGGYFVYLICQGEAPLGLALITAEIGKTEYFSFLVGLDLRQRVQALHVIDYREPRGGEVRRPGFRRQFVGAAAGTPLRLHREIENIPGATLSAVATIRGTKKALAVCKLWFGGNSVAALRKQFAGQRQLQLAAEVDGIHRCQFKAMGSVASLILPGVDARLAKRARRAVRAALAGVESRLSNWSADSELSRVQARLRRDGGPVQLSPELSADLGRALQAARRSAGAFDPTILPALQGQLRGSALQDCVGYDKVLLDRGRRRLALVCQGVGLSSDAFAKGLGVDAAVAALRRLGIRRARVGFRSSYYLLGSGHRQLLPDGRVVELGDCAVGASAAGPRGQPILDPRNLQPVPAGRAAMVVAADAFTADWAATAALVLGAVDGPKILAGELQQLVYFRPGS